MAAPSATAVAAAVTLSLIWSGCAGEKSGPRPPPAPVQPLQLDAPDYALSRDALDTRTLSATQAAALERTVRSCQARIDSRAAAVPSAARFRECAFRELAHSSISQRLNAVLALTLTRRLRGGACRANLFALASGAQTLAAAAEGVLRELNSQLAWDAREHLKLLALRTLARSTLTGLDARAWRRHCAPPAGSLVE